MSQVKCVFIYAAKKNWSQRSFWIFQYLPLELGLNWLNEQLHQHQRCSSTIRSQSGSDPSEQRPVVNSTGLLLWSKSKMFLSHLQTKTKIQGKYDLMRCDGSNLSLEVMSPFYIIESDTRKNCEITLSCEPTDSHLSAASVQYFSFSYSQKFFLTFFFNFLKKKLALVVCTRRKQLHTLLIRCNHSRPTNIHNTDEDFNSSTMFLSRFQKVLKSNPTSESATNTEVSNVGGFSSLWLNLHTDRNVCTTIIKNYNVIQL